MLEHLVEDGNDHLHYEGVVLTIEQRTSKLECAIKTNKLKEFSTMCTRRKTDANSRLPKLPLLGPDFLKQHLLLTPLVSRALVLHGYISDLFLPVAALQSRHQ